MSIFRDFTSVLGQGKQVWLFFFTSQCLYLEILHQCWGRGSKFDYTSSRLSVYIWRFCISVGAGEASLTILPHVVVSIFRDFESVLGQGKQVWLFIFTSQCLYLEILRQCWGKGSKFDYPSSHLVFIFRDFASVLGQGKEVWLLPHVLVSIFRDFVSVLGQGK